jgi:hypothetical protein
MIKSDVSTVVIIIPIAGDKGFPFRDCGPSHFDPGTSGVDAADPADFRDM